MSRRSGAGGRDAGDGAERHPDTLSAERTLARSRSRTSGARRERNHPCGRVGGRRLDPDGGSPARRDSTLLHRGRRAVLAVVWRRPHGPSGPADGHSADLEGQRIPTYEDVLEMEQDAIAAAGYEEKGGLACIYVETGEDALGYVEKYWVSVDSGLLVCAEQWKGEELTYRMTSYAVSTDRTLFGLTEFALPDGTVLHTVEE
ncbi:MAG: hypothetical protein ACLT5P_00590 [Flavonifractor plautii]